jgi:hypothetical protein
MQMRRYVFGCAVAGVLALAASVAAQNPSSAAPQDQPAAAPQSRPAPVPPAQPPEAPQPSAAPQRQPETRAAAPSDQAAAVTVEGCLMRDKDVPGRKQNIAERAGLADGYILTNAKMVKGSAPLAASAAQVRPGEPTGTSGTLSSMFDVKGIDSERLKEFAGQRVQIDGRFGDLERRASAKPTEDLVNIRGTAIRAASGECSQK